MFCFFPESRTLLEAPYPPEADLPEGTLLFTQFKLNGLIFNAMSSSIPHDFDFSEGNSFVVGCRNQAEIDVYWNVLLQDGEESMCGGLKDRFGVSGQIVPARLGELVNDEKKGDRVMQALMKMRKIDLGILESV